MGPSRPPWKQVAPQGPRREGRAWATGQEWLQKEARPSGHTPKAMSPGGQPARRDTGKHEWERPRRAESFTIRGAQRPGIALGPASDSVTARPQVRPLPSCNGAPTGLTVIQSVVHTPLTPPEKPLGIRSARVSDILKNDQYLFFRGGCHFQKNQKCQKPHPVGDPSHRPDCSEVSGREGGH